LRDEKPAKSGMTMESGARRSSPKGSPGALPNKPPTLEYEGTIEGQNHLRSNSQALVQKNERKRTRHLKQLHDSPDVLLCARRLRFCRKWMAGSNGHCRFLPATFPSLKL